MKHDDDCATVFAPADDFQRENSFENIEKVAPLWIARPNGKSWNFGRHSHIGTRELRLMTKFMPVRKMQIYFLSVAADKKALEGLHLHLLPPGVGGYLDIYDHGGWVGGWQCCLSQSSTDKGNPVENMENEDETSRSYLRTHLSKWSSFHRQKCEAAADCTKVQFVKQLCRAERTIARLIAN